MNVSLLSAWAAISNVFSGSTTDPTVCTTPACYATADYLRESIDFKVDPCDDFYRFACGRWYRNDLAETEAYGTYHDRFLRNSKENLAFLKQSNDASEPKCVHSVRKLFSTCLDTDAIDQKGIKPLVDALRRVHLTKSPPLLQANSNFDLIATTIEMQKSLGIHMFYAINMEGQNPYDVLESCISIYKPNIDSQPLPTKLIPTISDVGSSRTYQNVRRSYISLVFSLLCDDKRVGFCNLSNLERAENGLIERYTSALNEVKRRKTFYTRKYQFTITTLGHLQHLSNELAEEMNATALDWKRNLELAFSDPSIRIDEFRDILMDETYIRDILKFIYQFSLAEHELGLWWTVVDSLAEYSVSSLRSAKRSILDSYVGQDTREEWCENIVNRIYGPVVSYRYALDRTNEQIQKRVMGMLDRILVAFIRSLNSSLWMDKATTQRALNKMIAINALVSFPLPTDPNYDLNSYYKNCELADNFLESVSLKIMQDSVSTFQSQNKKDINLLKLKKFFLFYPPVRVNAFYLPRYNTLMIPAGILGYPLYSYDGLAATNYGSIGTIVGHEMAHALDVSGRLFNIEGQVEDWWDPQTLRKYYEIEECIIDTYNSLKVNGSNTLGENIADIVGFRQALFAYRSYVSQYGPELKLPHFESWSHEQLLTLSYANVWCDAVAFKEDDEIDHDTTHSKKSARVLGALITSQQFSRIWNCSVESRMYQSEHNATCMLW